MADDSGTPAGDSTPDLSAFSPEDLVSEADMKARAAAAKGAAPEAPEEPKDDDFDEYDFDPSKAMFEVADKDLPKKEEKKEDSEAKKPEEKKPEEKKAKGGDEAKTSQDSPKPEKAKSETESEASPPAPRNLVKTKIGEEEYEIPEKAADAVTGVVEKARRVQSQAQDLVKDLVGDKSYEVMLNLLSKLKFGGDRDAAYEHMIQQAAELVNREIQFRSLPQEKQEAIRAQKRAEQAEAELKRYREQEAASAKQAKLAAQTERLMGEVTQAMTKLGIPLSEENKDVAFQAARDLQLAAEQGRQPDVSLIVKRAKDQLDQKRAEFDKRLQARFEGLSPAELLKQYPALAERLVQANLDKLKAERSTAKTAGRAESPPAEQKKPHSRRKILTAEEWEDHWR